MKGVGIAFFICAAFSFTLLSAYLSEATDMEVIRNDYEEQYGFSFDDDLSTEVDLSEFSERVPSAYPPQIHAAERNNPSFDSLEKPAPATITVEANGYITIYINGVVKKRVKNSGIHRPVVIGRGEKLALKRGDIVGIRVITKTKRKGVRVLIRIVNKDRGSRKRGRKYFQFYTRSRHLWRASDKYERGWASEKFTKCWPSAVETMKKVRKRGKGHAVRNAKFFWGQRAKKTSTMFLRYKIGKRPCKRWQEAKLDGISYSCIPTWNLRARRRRRNQERIRRRGGGKSRYQDRRRTRRRRDDRQHWRRYGRNRRNRRNSEWNHDIAGQADSSSGRGTRRCDCVPSVSSTGTCYRFERNGATRGKCRKDKCGAKYECLGRRRRSVRARTCYEKRITTTIVRTGKNRCDTAPLKEAKFIWVPYD